MGHSVKFVKSGRGKSQVRPNPKYPNGIGVICTSPGTRTCKVDLPYPAPECGWFEIECRECKSSSLITASGRADDPLWIELPCKVEAN